MFCQYCNVSLSEENSSELTEMYNLCSECFHNPDTLIYFGQSETVDFPNFNPGEDYVFPLLKPRKEESDSPDNWHPQKPR